MIMPASGHKFHPYLPSVAAPRADKGFRSDAQVDAVGDASIVQSSSASIFALPGFEAQDWIDTHLFGLDDDDHEPSAFTLSDNIDGLAMMSSDNKRRNEDVDDWANYFDASSSTTHTAPSPFSAASPFMSTHASSAAPSPRVTSPIGQLAPSFGNKGARVSVSESPMFAPFVVPDSMPPPPMVRATRSTGTSPAMPVASMSDLQVTRRVDDDRLVPQLTDAQLDAIARAASSPQEAYAQGVLAGLTPDLADSFAKAVGAGASGLGDVPGPAPSNLARRMRQLPDHRYGAQTIAPTVVSMNEHADVNDINSNIDWEAFAATGDFRSRQQDVSPYDARATLPLQVASVPERPRMHQHTQSSDMYSFMMAASGINGPMPASAPADMPMAPPTKRFKERAPSKRSSTSRSPKGRDSASPGPFSTSATDNGSPDERLGAGDIKDPIKQARRREINRKSAQTMRLKRKEQLKEAEQGRDVAEKALEEAAAELQQLRSQLYSEREKRKLAEDRLRQAGHFVPHESSSVQLD